MKKDETRPCETCGTPMLRGEQGASRWALRRFCSIRCRVAERRVAALSRFDSLVQKGEPDECWEWQATRLPTGYGRTGSLHLDEYAHRQAFMLAHGPIPKGLVVMHSCDNPPCCNPAHLSLGTTRDNARDMSAKGRSPVSDQRGTANPAARLTEAQVRELRAAIAGGMSKAAAGRQFGVTATAAAAAASGKTWRHVA